MVKPLLGWVQSPLIGHLSKVCMEAEMCEIHANSEKFDKIGAEDRCRWPSLNAEVIATAEWTYQESHCGRKLCKEENRKDLRIAQVDRRTCIHMPRHYECSRGDKTSKKSETFGLKSSLEMKILKSYYNHQAMITSICHSEMYAAPDMTLRFTVHKQVSMQGRETPWRWNPPISGPTKWTSVQQKLKRQKVCSI